MYLYRAPEGRHIGSRGRVCVHGDGQLCPLARGMPYTSRRIVGVLRGEGEWRRGRVTARRLYVLYTTLAEHTTLVPSIRPSAAPTVRPSVRPSVRPPVRPPVRSVLFVARYIALAPCNQGG